MVHILSLDPFQDNSHLFWCSCNNFMVVFNKCFVNSFFYIVVGCSVCMICERKNLQNCIESTASFVFISIFSGWRGATTGQKTEGSSLPWSSLCQETSHLLSAHFPLSQPTFSDFFFIIFSQPTFSDSIYDLARANLLSDIFSQYQSIIIKALSPPCHCARRCRLWEVQSDQLSLQPYDRYPPPAWWWSQLPSCCPHFLHRSSLGQYQWADPPFPFLI